MPRLSQHHFTYSFRLRHLVVLMAMIAILAQPSLAQTYTILHTFTGGMDGGDPYSGLSIDQAGNLYGTAAYGGRGFGVVYELARKNAGWIFHPLYNFAGGTNGEGPLARVTFGANGTLYGTTYAGGNVACGEGLGCGTVFNVRPSPTFCRAASCPWMQTVLYRFNGDNDGANPLFGDLTFDASGNMYGTTSNGGGTGCGGAGCGIVYELSHNAGGWSESVLHTFTGENGDGANPNAGVVFDAAGNLYGTTKSGGTAASNGTVFRLVQNGSRWIETVLYAFGGESDGYWPLSGLIFDRLGNLYGATTSGGLSGGGTIFSLNTSGAETTIYSFAGPVSGGPYGNLTMDAAGNLYGVTYDDGASGNGLVFKLTPSPNGWIYTDLHDFTGFDGRCPYGNVVIDAQGNLYGTAQGGGQHDYGVVWEITP